MRTRIPCRWAAAPPPRRSSRVPKRRLHRGPVSGPVAVEAVGLSAFPRPRSRESAPRRESSRWRSRPGCRSSPPRSSASTPARSPPSKLRSSPPSVRTAQGAVVAGITVLEAVGEEEVDRRAVPEGRWADAGERRPHSVRLSCPHRAPRRDGSSPRSTSARRTARPIRPRVGTLACHVPASGSSRSSTRSVSRAARKSDAPPISERVDRLPAEEATDEETEQGGRDDLGDHDEEIEDAHVVAHLRRRQRACQDRVRHGEDAGPGDSDPDHRAQQESRVLEHEDRQEPERAARQADRVRDLAIGPPGQDRECRKRRRRRHRCRCRSRPPPSWRPRCRGPRSCRWCRRDGW